MNEMYDRVIDMLCFTGRIPLNMVENVCNYARKSIDNALALADGDRKSRTESRNKTIFGDIASFRDDYKSAWLDYEEEWACNFSIQ